MGQNLSTPPGVAQRTPNPTPPAPPSATMMAAAVEDANVLPIRRFADDIVAAVRGNDTVTVIGETGSGKTTQLAQVAHGRADGSAFRGASMH